MRSAPRFYSNEARAIYLRCDMRRAPFEDVFGQVMQIMNKDIVHFAELILCVGCDILSMREIINLNERKSQQ